MGKSSMKMNTLRSGVVVIGALAFGYLSLQLGFKPFLERAQAASQFQTSHRPSQSQSQQHTSFRDD